MPCKHIWLLRQEMRVITTQKTRVHAFFVLTSYKNAGFSRFFVGCTGPEKSGFLQHTTQPPVQNAHLPCALTRQEPVRRTPNKRVPSCSPTLRAGTFFQSFSMVHCNGCWFCRARSMTCETLVSATSYVNTPHTPTPLRWTLSMMSVASSRFF